MTRISAKWSVVFIGVIAIISLSFAAYAAGDSGKEISTAAQHAGLAAKATTIDMVHTHLQHVVNCLVGAKGTGFDAKAANPCGKLGDGAIPDASDAHMKETLGDAVKIANMGLASNDLATAQKSAMDVEAALKKAS